MTSLATPPLCPVCGGESRLLFPATTTDAARLSRQEQFVCTSLDVSDHNDIFRCHACATGFLWPQPTIEELKKLYGQAVDTKYIEEEAGRTATWTRVFRQALQFGQGKTLLDIGAHTGLFVKLANDRGWNAIGVDPNEWAQTIARERYGAKVLPSIEALTAARYDAITMFDVIEHVSNPVAELQRVATLLNDGGKLVITTPDAGSPLARIMRSKWHCIRQQHIFYFDTKSITTLLNRAGFRVLTVKRYHRTFSIGYWLDRVATLLHANFIARRVSRIPGLVTIPTGDEMLIVAERQ